MTNYMCPVCGYDELRYPPKDFYICPCCGVEFEAADAPFEELRAEWVAGGMRWWSIATRPPKDWDATKQLQRVIHITGRPK